MGNVTRGDGTTTEQMRSAPKAAIYVWCTGLYT